MRTVKIVRMSLENFKCHRNLKLDFNGGSVSLYGDNAAGKTSIYDALTWLLFGKDSAGNGEKNIEVKPLDSTGAVIDHSAITSVEAELLVDDEPVVLRRTYREVWTTRRGSSTETFSGNTSEYYVDGVPQQKKGFDERINGIVPEDIFRLLTSVTLFAQDMPWQKRREILFDMAGTLSDREIMEQNDTFKPLLEGMGKLSLDDYKKKLAAERRNFTGVKTEIPARISECQKTVEDLQNIDFAAVKAEADVLASNRDELAARIVANENSNALSGKRLELREAQLEMDKLDADNRAYRAKQLSAGPDVNQIKRTLNGLSVRIANNDMLLEAAVKSLEQFDVSIENSRNRWIAVNGEAFSGGSCPTCGQQLPMEQLQAAVAKFEADKQRRLREIADNGESQKVAKTAAESHVQQLKNTAATLALELQEAQRQLSEAESAVITPTDMEGYETKHSEIQKRITAINGEIQAMMQSTAAINEQLRMELLSVRSAISEKNAILGKESALQYARRRIEELRLDAQNAAECLESIDRMLYLADEYSRFKTKYVEGSVNSLFRIARFRLYREQANGGVEDRCDVVYDGVPYQGLNSGMKINVGIDIINSLSRHHGVSVPLFIDNAESVTHLENADTQVIRLVVSESDKKLRCVNES